MELSSDFRLENERDVIVVWMYLFCVFDHAFCDIWGAVFLDHEDVSRG